MEFLINRDHEAWGKKENLEIKIFGGGRVLDSVSTNIGERNVSFVKYFLRKEGL